MGNKKNSEKMLKKMRIRLTDPQIPDSYVCEILENSMDGENNCTPLDGITLESTLRPIEGGKLKNYFEVLMSNEYRKNLQINPVGEGNKIIQEKITIKDKDNKEKIQVKKVDSHCKQLRQNDSSDDETLFQIKKKCKFINGSPQSENVYHSKILSEIELFEEKIYDSPKATKNDFIFKRHQNTNILSYFSSTENNKELQVIKFEQPKKMTDIDQPKEKQSNIVNTNEENSSSKANKKNVKLAPLFIKKEKKIIDPDVQKARIDFLHKRLPPLKNLKSNKNMEFSEDFAPTLHVQQRDDNIYWSKRDILLPFNVAPDKKIDFEVIMSKIFRLDICRNSTINDKKGNGDRKTSDTVEASTESLGKLKSKYKNLNLDIVIDKLKQKQDKFTQLSCNLQSLKSVNEKSNSDKVTKDDSSLEVFNTLWTDKYKPSSNEILGNENTVKKLKTWLQNWKDFDKELKSFNHSNKKKKETDSNDGDDDDDSESDYFVDSGDENHGLKAPCNICTLSGPNGCGKTALVFALAEELEFNVVEINSSCKRSGKQVLAYFQEATQSHKVHRVALPMVEHNQQNQKKKRRRKEKTKKPIIGKALEGKDSKISLLLIEDADVVFEDKDDGFYGAIASLVQTSKRPFIFISNDLNYTLMDNLKSEKSLALKMKYPPFYKSCAVLDVVSVLEGNPTNRKIIEFIVQRNHCDLRRSLLDLQFWVGADKENLISNRNLDLGELWWGSFNFLHRRNLKHLGEVAGVKRKRQNHLFDSSDDDNDEVKAKKFKQNLEDKNRPPTNDEVFKSKPNMRLYFEVLDVMSIVDLVGSSKGAEPIPNRFHKVKDSLSLEEKLEDVDWTEEEIKKDLTEELISLSARAFVEASNDERIIKMEFPSWEEIRWRKSQEDARQELSALLPITNGTDGRSTHLDYLPIMRNICRTEKNRSITNSKRKNRFSHYFNSSSELSGKNLEISQRVFSC